MTQSSTTSIPGAPGGHVGDVARLGEHTVNRALRDETGVECLRAKRDGIATYRVHARGGIDDLILKIWTRRGWRHVVRDVAGTNECVREWQALQILYGLHVSVPSPLWRWRGRTFDGRIVEAMACQDLGSCERVGDVMAQVLADGDNVTASAIEDAMAEITTQMIRAGLLDIDHSATNFVRNAGGTVFRIDLEFARRVDQPRTAPRRVASMLARLLGTYTFAVQPHHDRVQSLASRLQRNLDLSPRVQELVAARLERMFERQRIESGIETDLDLTW